MGKAIYYMTGKRVLSYVLGFTGAWFFLITYIPYALMVEWGFGFAKNWGNIEPIVLLLSIAISLTFFCINCYLTFFSAPTAASGDNVPEFMMSTNIDDVGFFLGTKSKGFSAKTTFYVGKPQNRDGNILVDGVVGSGKSAAIAKNVLKTWTTPIFATDIKGELSQYYSKLMKIGEVSRDYIVFDPTQSDSWGYDPYYLLRHGGEENLVQNASELALSIIPMPKNIREPFWIEAAQNMLIGAILYCFGKGLSFSETMIKIQTTKIDKLMDEIDASDNQNAIMYINQLTDLEMKVLANIGTTIANKIMAFATDPQLKNVFRNSQDENSKCFTWNDLESKHIFLCVPSDKISRWGSMITLMTNQLIRSLERRPDKTTKEGKNLLPILLLLDEIARFGRINALLEGITTLRSKSVTFALFIQSLAQFDLFYGSNESKIIAGNCEYKAIIRVVEPQSQEYYSKLVGTSEVRKESGSTNYADDGLVETSSNKSWRFAREKIMQPEEFGWLDGEIVLLTPQGYCRVDKVFAPRLDDVEIGPTPPEKTDDDTDGSYTYGGAATV